MESGRRCRVHRCLRRFIPRKNRIYYVQQVEQYLSEAIDEFCNVDASWYEAGLDVGEAIRSASCFSPDGYDFDEDDAASTLDEYIRDEAFQDLQAIISKLPEHFKYLADNVQADDIMVDGSDLLVQEYLSDPPGHYDPDKDEDTDDDSYSPIDAIFQR